MKESNKYNINQDISREEKLKLEDSKQFFLQ